MSLAFGDVIVEAMMVIQAKNDPRLGSQELLSFAWIVQGIAAIVGGVTASVLLQYTSPYYCYFIYGMWGLVQFVVAAKTPISFYELRPTDEA